MNLWKSALDLFGWKVSITTPYLKKCVICVAPHTSNWDFLLGLAAYKSLGREANFLMKKFWFFFPLGIILRRLGGIPVDRKRKGYSLTENIINDFNTSDYINLAVTPEGTRSRRSEWRTGFLYIAYGAKVPILLGLIDFKNKIIRIEKEYHPTGDVSKDMSAIKKYYANSAELAKYPDKFTV